MKKLWHDFCIAIGNTNRYRELLKNSGRRMVAFFAVLVLFTSIFTVLLPAVGVARNLENIFAKDFPEFRLSREGFQIDQTVELDTAMVLIRASDAVEDPAELDEYLSAIVLDSEKLIVKNGSQTGVVAFSDLLDEGDVFQKSDLVRLRPFFRLMMLLAGVLMEIFMILKLLFSALVLAVAAQILFGKRAAQVRFEGCFRLALYTRTLPMLLEIFLSFFGIVLFPFLGMLISGIMLWLALKNDPSTQLETAE